MKILADRNILAVEDRFSRHGELRLFDGRRLAREDLREADALLVRSITRVDEALLAGTELRFVGTATSGIDHIDCDYLRARDIGFAHAKGSNANAVVDYCFAGLAYAVLNRGLAFEDCSVGIVGAGEVGGRFAARLEALGIEAVCCDPFLSDEAGGREYRTLEAALGCDVVSLHVPLCRSGPHPTYKMLGASELQRLRTGAVLINACRGLVVDEAALKSLLAQRADLVAVFDVWAGEPAIDAELASRVDIATPHIAGYSQQAKLNATEILARAFERHFDLHGPAAQDTQGNVSEPLRIETGAAATAEWQTLLAAFPLQRLSAQFKAAVEAGSGTSAFDSFRQQLLQRREWSSSSLPAANYSPSQQQFLRTLGFRLS